MINLKFMTFSQSRQFKAQKLLIFKNKDGVFFRTILNFQTYMITAEFLNRTFNIHFKSFAYKKHGPGYLA